MAVTTAVALSLTFSDKEADSVRKDMKSDAPFKSDSQALLVGKEQSEMVVRQFFTSTSVENVTSKIRHPYIIKPLMDLWYASHTLIPLTQLEFDESRMKEFGNSRHYLQFVLLPD